MSQHADTLRARLADRSAVIGVVGLGYVGLPLVGAMVDAGFRVIGFDVDRAKIDAIDAGRDYISHLVPESGGEFVGPLVRTGRFDATTEFARLGEPDAVLICVPTPLGPHNDPDLSYVEQTTDDIARSLRPGQLVVLESTTYPTTTRGVMKPRLDATGLRCGDDYFLAYSPEREDPGRKDRSTAAIPKVVGGVDDVSGGLARDLYSSAVREVVLVDSAEIAEASKLLENIYRAVNIALVNEMKVVLDAMGIDIWKVIEASETKPFGFQAFYPGPGLGGHCIPIDPYYLTWKARGVGLNTRFIELAGEVNRSMPGHVIARLTHALNDRGKPVRGSRVLVLGLAYKPNVDDTRESPSYELISRLIGLGADVSYNDPHIPKMPQKRDYDLSMSSVELTPEALRSCDAVLISTDHDAYDWAMIAKHAPLIVDTRGACRHLEGPDGHIVRA
ncbi:MAG: nucleotide sugar dehydrogenase [Planctomycetota bacterium]